MNILTTFYTFSSTGVLYYEGKGKIRSEKPINKYLIAIVKCKNCGTNTNCNDITPSEYKGRKGYYIENRCYGCRKIEEGFISKIMVKLLNNGCNAQEITYRE